MPPSRPEPPATPVTPVTPVTPDGGVLPHRVRPAVATVPAAVDRRGSGEPDRPASEGDHSRLPPPPDAPDQPLKELQPARAGISPIWAIPLIVVFSLAVAGVGWVVLDGGRSNPPSPLSAGAEGGATGDTLASAKGRPCVPLADPLPTGAPAGAVVVGPAPTRVVSRDLRAGTGAKVASTGTVTANFVGVACSTGRIFASSYTEGGPMAVPLSQVMAGWSEGLEGMKVGGVRLISVPADQAFGSDGFPPLVAPDDAVWFVVEVTADSP